jgi:class 3 adenylate cyclase
MSASSAHPDAIKQIQATAPQTQRIIKFRPEASPPIKALVLVADLHGFSHFFSQPDVQLYVPRFLNHIFAALNRSFKGGLIPWLDEKNPPYAAFPDPMHAKFQGDGALYIWEYNDALYIQEFFCMLHLFQQSYHEIIATCINDIPLADIPQGIRFGLAASSVYRLTYESGSGSEYIGYAINLASRLQKYCPQLGFIASARVDLPNKWLKKNGLMRVVATNIAGFPKEIVIVHEHSFHHLSQAVEKPLFDRF